MARHVLRMLPGCVCGSFNAALTCESDPGPPESHSHAMAAGAFLGRARAAQVRRPYSVTILSRKEEQEGRSAMPIRLSKERVGKRFLKGAPL